ncbi:MAG TPA: DUF6159 family protein [Methanotrichaceae archaeon]|nr:DUF6159 family protein [Methanotrichaceae archaeon]
MLERIPMSWELIKASAAVLISDKKLLIFPIISAIGMLVVTATFALPLSSTGGLDHEDLGPSSYLVLFAFYLAQYFVAIYANSALVGATLIKLRGGDPTVRDGLRIASSHLGSIMSYAAISAIAGVILRWFQEIIYVNSALMGADLIRFKGGDIIVRDGLRTASGHMRPVIGYVANSPTFRLIPEWFQDRGSLGITASSIFGLAWSLATFLAVPVLVAEDLGPMESVQRSMQLLRKTWGEQVVGNFSISLIFWLFLLASMIVGIGAVFLLDSAGSDLLILSVVIVILIVMSILVLSSSALSGIFSAAVYSYAATGSTGGFFREDLIRGAFRTKGRASIQLQQGA